MQLRCIKVIQQKNLKIRNELAVRRNKKLNASY